MTVSSRVMAIGHQTQTMHSTAKMAGAMSTASKVKLFLYFFVKGKIPVLFSIQHSHAYWPIRGHLTSNNKNVSHQKIL